MHASILQFLRCRHGPHARGGPAPVAAVLAGALVLAAILAGCRGREVTLTDLSNTVKLAPPDPGAKVVGLMLETELDAQVPVRMNIGCKGVPEATVTVPKGRSEQRIDWYSDCAELSFPADGARARALTIRYRFQTL